jgi:hypothetical protein
VSTKRIKLTPTIYNKNNNLLTDAIIRIKELMANSRKVIFSDINKQALKTYWKIGQVIVEKEQEGKVKARYGDRLLVEFSKELSREIGKGFSRSNLQNMRKLYVLYPICQTASGKLS